MSGWRRLPELVHSERNPEDLDTRQEDHAADALRYMVADYRAQIRDTKAKEGFDFLRVLRLQSKRERPDISQAIRENRVYR